jgi:hypothetical protein
MSTLPPAPPAPGPPPWPQVAPPRQQRWSVFAALAIAVAAITLAIASWFRPLPSVKPSASPALTYTDQQIAGAKAAVCAAFGQVDHALELAYARNGGSDPTAQLAVAASSQLALDAGSRYLSMTLAEEPATPPDLATAVRKQTDAYQKALIGFLNGIRVSDPAQQPTVNASDEATLTIRRLCK